MVQRTNLKNPSGWLRTGIAAGSTGIVLMISDAHPALGQRFNIVEYEYPQEYYIIEVNAINNRAEMVGTGHRERGGSTALLWRADGRVIELPFLLPSPAPDAPRYRQSAQAHDINDDGVIAGRAEGRIYPQYAVLWTDEHTIVDLLGRDSVAYDVSNSLVVTGIYGRSGFGIDPFVWENGQWMGLYPPMIDINDLNNLGQAVGEDGFSALIFDQRSGQFTFLPALRPDAWASATAINDLGQVGGWSEKDTDLYHPVYWENGRVRELARVRQDTMASVASLNARGEMTGSTFYPELRPVYYRNNFVMMLNDLLLDAVQGDWRVNVGPRLNDAGQIGGRAYHYPRERAFPVRLDPVDTGLTLWSIEPSRPGVRNEIQINHATPGGRVSLLWGTTRGEPQPLEQCPGALIDIIDPRLAATAVAGPDRRALIRVNIPADVDGTYMLQVVDHETCEVSPPAWAIIQPEN